MLKKFACKLFYSATTAAGAASYLRFFSKDASQSRQRKKNPRPKQRRKKAILVRIVGGSFVFSFFSFSTELNSFSNSGPNVLLKKLCETSGKGQILRKKHIILRIACSSLLLERFFLLPCAVVCYRDSDTTDDKSGDPLPLSQPPNASWRVSLSLSSLPVEEAPKGFPVHTSSIKRWSLTGLGARMIFY